MTEVRISMPTSGSIGTSIDTKSNGNDDMLETMLREAEMLAAKMVSPKSAKPKNATAGNSAATRSTATSADLNQVPDAMEGSFANQDARSGCSKSTDVPNNRGPRPAKAEDQGNLDDVLRQSEALLDKMKTKGSTDASASTPVENLATEAPTSVYVLHEASIPDDVSSVGSQSLRHAAFSSRGAKLASSMVNVTDALNTSRYMAESLRQLTNIEEPHPSTPTPAEPDDSTPVDHSSSCSSSANKQSISSRSARFQAPIPDFHRHNPNATWEKVVSAQAGDEDYVEVVDFSAEKGTNLIAPLPQRKTRLESFKEKAKIRRKQQLRTLGVSIVLLLVLGVAAFVHQSKHLPAHNNNNNSVGAKRSIIDGSNTHSSNSNNSVGNISQRELDMESINSVMEGSAAEQETGATAASAAAQPSHAIVGSMGAVSVTEDLPEAKVAKTKSFVEHLFGQNQSMKTEPEEPAEIAVPINSNALSLDSASMPKGCRNFFFRVFRKKCRAVVRERKENIKVAQREAKIQQLMSAKNY